MRRALLVVVIGVAVLVAATYASGGKPGANGLVNVGSHAYSIGGGSCQTIGGDFSVSIADTGHYFHLLWTPKNHGNYRSVAWRYTYISKGTVLGAKIKFAAGRKSGTFSGLNADGVRTTGSFNCE